MTDKTGGPAFPVSENYDEAQSKYTQYASDGMTLRDYFAINAKEEDIKFYMPCRSGLQGPGITDTLAKTREHARYMFADAMLKEREK